MRFIYSIGILIILNSLLVSCKRKAINETLDNSIDTIDASLEGIGISDTIIAAENIQEDIYGDTVWVYPYGNQAWYSSISEKKFKVTISVWVDTTDYLIDTVRSAKGNRIVIGYNHYYSLAFRKNEKPWFFLNFNKKKDLYSLIYGTDLWLESNLNIVNNIVYNEKFGFLIIEMSINSGDEFNSMFYLISDTEGKIIYSGTISSWGGGGPDGAPFLTDDGRMYVTCHEVYNFVTGTAINLAEYATMAQLLSNKNNTAEYIQIHGLRYLSNNNFLVVFNRFHNKSKYNALILNTDSLVVNQFGYYSLIEDIDAILLFEELKNMETSFLYDTEREVLISIKQDDIPIINETGLYEMTELDKNILLSPDYQSLNFGFYGSYEFYISPNDSILYYSFEKMN